MAKSEHLLVHRIFHGPYRHRIGCCLHPRKGRAIQIPKLDASSGKAELFTPVTKNFGTLQEAIDYAHDLLRRLNSDFGYVENPN